MLTKTAGWFGRKAILYVMLVVAVGLSRIAISGSPSLYLQFQMNEHPVSRTLPGALNVDFWVLILQPASGQAAAIS